MKRAKNIILILLLFITELSVIQAQELISVYPKEYPKALKNPLKGFRPDPNFTPSTGYPYPTIVRQYIKWSEIEKDSTDGVQKIIDFCNVKWKDFEKRNIKVIPRVYIQWDKNDTKGNWPADLTYGDWSSPKFKDRVVKLIYKLGQAWDNDPRVAWVQTGIIGWWGEQENPVGVDEDGWAQRLGDAFDGAFKNKKFIVRNQNVWESAGYELGTYWDSYGHPSQSGVHFEIKERNAQGRYLTEVIEGETAYNWGNDTWNPKYGASPTITCNNYKYTNNLVDAIRDLHCTGLGWIASYKVDGTDGSNIDTVKANAARIQEAFGYNFVIPEFSCSRRADQGTPLKIKFKVKNTGSAPFYQNWPLAFVLIDETTQAIVWKEQLNSVDIRKWHPGDNYSYTSRTYLTPAQVYAIDTTITVPGTVLTGNYMAGITILEPYSQTPGIFFDIKNFLSKSQTQPLCRIGIGKDLVGSYEVNPTLFGDPLTNDTRSYSLIPKGLTYSVSTTNPTNGSVTIYPVGGKYLPGTVVTVIAKANLGYKLKSWSGDLSGSNTVTTITMDGNKSISANFEKVIIYGLTKSAINGSIITTPAGSTFEADTKITVTANANVGYKFKGWSGDLSGMSNPATIVMDANKSITANFEKSILFELKKSAVNGSISTKPSGSTLEEGTNVTVRAIADFGYKFTGWGGDLSGLTNPAFFVMDANKNITANFTKVEGTVVFATNCGGPEFTASDGVKYSADARFISGSTYSVTTPINATTDDLLYQSERWGASINYNIPLFKGTYQVMLMYAEINYSAPNERVFNVYIEGAKVITDLDIYAEVSSNTAYNETFFVDVNDGYLNISLDGVKENAKISAIKVLKFSSNTGINDLSNPGQEQTKLGQNYPNPFQTGTTIPYQLKKASPVRLTIYNYLGQQVATLVNEFQNEGEYTVYWNAQNSVGKQFISGIYFYRLETEHANFLVRKLLIDNDMSIKN